MELAKPEEKSGQALNAQRFRMLEDIARELNGDVTFPVCFDVAMELRRVLNDPNQSVQGVCKVVSADPLISSKLLRLANSVGHHPGGGAIRDVKSAIIRLGTNTVRSTAIAVALRQLMLSRGMAEFGEMMKGLWNHSILTASACHVIARRLSRVDPDMALLAGLVHDLGSFYMLYRASRYEELRARPVTMKHLVVEWHESIGDTLLNALGLPEDIVKGVREHEHPRWVPAIPRGLGDIVYVGNVLAGGVAEWLFQDIEAAERDRRTLDDSYLFLLQEIHEHADEMRAAFA